MIAELACTLGYVASRGSFKQVTSDWASHMFNNRDASVESVFVGNSVDDKTTINCSPCPCPSFVSCGEFLSRLGGARRGLSAPLVRWGKRCLADAEDNAVRLNVTAFQSVVIFIY